SGRRLVMAITVRSSHVIAVSPGADHFSLQFMIAQNSNGVRMIIADGLAHTPRRETLQCTHAVAVQNEIELALVVRQSRPLAFRMPQVQHAGCKAPVLTPHAAADEPNEEIGILQPPAGEGGIEAIDALEIISQASH